MPKVHTHFVCQQCGRATSRSFGRCPTCGTYGSMVEELLPELNPSTKNPRALSGSSKPLRLNEITSTGEERLMLSIGEFSRVLGGGIVPGSIILVGGDPGIGKSTLLLQLALESSARTTILYVSGE